jgi:hypothetical protein
MLAEIWHLAKFSEQGVMPETFARAMYFITSLHQGKPRPLIPGWTVSDLAGTPGLSDNPFLRWQQAKPLQSFDDWFQVQNIHWSPLLEPRFIAPPPRPKSPELPKVRVHTPYLQLTPGLSNMH